MPREISAVDWPLHTARLTIRPATEADLEPTGRGYATEAAAELLRLCFEDLGVRRVTAQTFTDNVASWRLMERLVEEWRDRQKETG